MSGEKDTKPEMPAVRKTPKLATKKATKKPSTPARYVVAAGKSLCAQNGIIDAGEKITADDVADIEALIKGGFVVKA